MNIRLFSLLFAGTSALAQTPPPAPADLPVPAIPPIILPDIASKTPAQIAFENKLPSRLDPGNGLRIEPAHCEGNTLISADVIQSIDSKSAQQVKKDSVLEIRADGSGSMVTEDTVLTVNADGSGILTRDAGSDTFTLNVNADGSGEYIGPEGTISADGKGGGKWVGEFGTITIKADGSGEWIGGDNILTIKADGSGEWLAAIPQTNNGDGTGTHGVMATPVAMEPWPPAPKVGKFDLLKPFAMPGQVCGYLISLDDRVLFDFDKYDLRPDASRVLAELASALAEIRAPGIEVRGHTDSKGSDEYNQTLSENRAKAVQQDLQNRANIMHISARGYGESLPVAPNEVDGKDSPANRQLNRRVEIFVRVQ